MKTGKAQVGHQSVRERAAANRARMPGTAAEVDQFRARFGPDARVTYAREGDLVVGKPSPPQRTMNADQWLHYLATGELPTC